MLKGSYLLVSQVLEEAVTAHTCCSGPITRLWPENTMFGLECLNGWNDLTKPQHGNLKAAS